jgi:phosphoenolpyruvate phosphomutase
MQNKATVLRRVFQTKPILRILGAHDGLGAKLIEKHGFDGVWASGLEISTSYAVPDANILTMTENLHAGCIINEATTLPVICDCDTGYGNASNVRHMVKKYEAAGIAAVVIEDKLFPKVNSFIPGRQELAGIEEFTGKLKAAKNAQVHPDFMVLARVESLIAGWGMEETLKRAYAYAEAGADGLVIHSKAAMPDEIYDFMKKWKSSLPVVVIPTTFYKVKTEELSHHGVRMVIYANHGLRASIRAMEETFKEILETGSTGSVENKIASMREVFDIQGMRTLKDDEEKYMQKESVQAVIPAAGDRGFDRPVCMLEVGGKTLLEHQMDNLRSCGVRDILVVGGVTSDKIAPDGAQLMRNADSEKSGVAYTWMLARDWVKTKCVMLYSDIIFDRNILERLLESPHEITLVIDRAYRTLPPRDKRLDLVIAPEQVSKGDVRKLGQDYFRLIQKIGCELEKQNANYEFIGMAFFREKGLEFFAQAWDEALKKFQGKRFYESESVEKADFNDVIQFLIDRRYPVHGLEIEHGWSEIHSLEDYERVDSYFRETLPVKRVSRQEPAHK